jgi:hypothetical protein
MANELNFPFSPGGQTIVAQVFDEGWTQQGSNVTMTEFATALYRGNMPGSVPRGEYIVLFRLTTGTGTIVGQGPIAWDGTREIDAKLETNDIWWRDGLDPLNNTTFRPDKIFTGSEGAPLLEIVLTGTCDSEIVANRT